MKKIFLTVLTSAALSGGLFAQVTQDTTKFEGDSIMIRDQAQQPADQTEDAMEQTSDDIRDGANAVQDSVNNTGERAGESIEQGAQKTGDAIEEGAEKTGDAIQEGAQKTGDALQEGTQKTGDAIEEGAQKTGDAIQEGAQKTGDAMEEGAEKTDDAMGDRDAGEGAGTSAGVEQVSFGPMVEVIEEKEGPNHEVVYKVNGEMFYVDREQKQLVKAEESNLKDAKDPAVIHTGSSTSTKSK